MEYTILGKTGRKVSRIGFGGATAGIKNYTGEFDPESVKMQENIAQTIKLAYELGINYFDTAPAYGDGISERIFGNGLKGIPEDDIFLATKCNVKSYDETLASIDNSLKRLQRNYVDLLQIHGTVYTMQEYDSIMEKGGMLDALERAKSEGLIKHIGFSIECQNVPLYNFLNSGRFDVMQVQYNVFYQHPYDPNWKCGSMYDAENLGLGIVTMRSLTSGVFQNWMKHINPSSTFDFNTALLQYVLSNPLVDVALLGMRDKDIVKRNVEICDDISGRISLEDINFWY